MTWRRNGVSPPLTMGRRVETKPVLHTICGTEKRKPNEKGAELFNKNVLDCSPHTHQRPKTVSERQHSTDLDH